MASATGWDRARPLDIDREPGRDVVVSGRAKRLTVRGLWATRAAARPTAGATDRAGKPLWATVRLTPRTMRGTALAAA
jgi:hypothetical protein